MKAIVMAALLAAAAQPVRAEDVPVEVTTLGTSQVTLHVHDFLLDEELTVLRLVATDPNALALFVPTPEGFAAMAASPDHGFIRDGAPVPAAVAVSGFPDAASAQAEALAACERAREGEAPCVIVLEVAPAA